MKVNIIQKYISSPQRASILKAAWKLNTGFKLHMIENLQQLDGSDSWLSLT